MRMAALVMPWSLTAGIRILLRSRHGSLRKSSRRLDLRNALACAITKESYDYFKVHFPMESVGNVSCFVKLYDYLSASDTDTLIDLTEFKALLQRQIKYVISYDTTKWTTEYVCKPSFFIRSRSRDFYEENRELCEYEYELVEIRLDYEKPSLCKGHSLNGIKSIEDNINFIKRQIYWIVKGD